MRGLNFRNYVVQLRTILLKGADISLILSLHEESAKTLKFIQKKPEKFISGAADRFAYSFLNQLNPLDSRFVKYEKKITDSFSWTKFYDFFHLYLQKNCTIGTPEEIRKYVFSLLPSYFGKSKFEFFYGPRRQKAILALEFFLEPENLSKILKNYALLQKEFPRNNCLYSYSSFWWKAKKIPGGLDLKINHAMATFSEKKTLRFVNSILRGDRSAFNQIFEDVECIENRRRLKGFSRKINHGKGIFQNLDEIRDEVLIEFFPEITTKASIFWSDRFAVRKLAHYDFSRDEIGVSLIFDLPGIDRELLRFLIYHELAHRKIGIRVTSERILAHTKQFRSFEKEYPNFWQINETLNRYATGSFISIP